MSRAKILASKGGYGGLRIRVPSRRHKVESGAVEVMASIIEAFVADYRGGVTVDPSASPLYELFRSSSYGLGFVTEDGRHAGVPLLELISDPNPISEYDFVQLRRLIHTLWRAENWNNDSVSVGDSPICRSVRSGLLIAVAQRLREIVDLARAAEDTV